MYLKDCWHWIAGPVLLRAWIFGHLFISFHGLSANQEFCYVKISCLLKLIKRLGC